MQSQPKNKAATAAHTTLGILKYLVPVAGTVLSIFLHNKQTALRVGEAVDVFETATGGINYPDPVK